MTTVLSAAIVGIRALPVQVQCTIDPDAPPDFRIIGLPEHAVRETRVRVRSAIKHSGLTYPTGCITVEVQPLDLRKENTSFDLAIALAVLGIDTVGWVVAGELSLTGDVRAVSGVACMAELSSERNGANWAHLGLCCSDHNAREAYESGAFRVRGVGSLQEAHAFFAVPIKERAYASFHPLPDLPRSTQIDWADVRGHEQAKRALLIAAAGRHHVLLVGTPGTGKTMLARRLPGILPPMSTGEQQEITKVQSVTGLLGSGAGLARVLPFRAPHHTCSASALVGGGTVPRPGEVSLAHRGVLLLDELAEFLRHVLESLRQALEEGHVNITRGGQTATFPARFQLVAALNPCPGGCGKVGCRCTPVALERYRGRLSPWLLQQFDIQIELQPLKPTELRAGVGADGMTTAQAQEMVVKAREVLASYEGGNHVADPLYRVARTIAALRGSTHVNDADLAEARGYRCWSDKQEK